MSDLALFTTWLEQHRVGGYIGEVGWPHGEDASRWNALAEAWFQAADAAGLWVTAWATGESWRSDYPLALYEARGDGGILDTPAAQAVVLERHLGSERCARGVNVAGGEFASPVAEPSAAFSNEDPGTHGTSYRYDSQGSFDFLAARGIGLIRLPFRWERLQPDLGGELDALELSRMERAVSRAGAAGLEVILDMHNYGAYYLAAGRRGIRSPVGCERCTLEHFAAAWAQISDAFRAHEAAIGYGLMNEPVDLEPAGRLSSAGMWQEASQRALDGIRARDDGKLVLVSGYQWSSVGHWAKWNPRPWISDPAGNFLYEAHHYFDRDNSGRYVHSYEEEVEDAAARGY